MARVFSAPGKALLAGGYLVLDREYDSYVVALSSRMHAVIETEEADAKTTIIVKSPQFLEGEWSYYVGLEDLSLKSEGNNPFVHNTVLTVLSYFKPTTNTKLNITIFSDSGYHSQENVITKRSGSKQFTYHSEKITDVAKTGLGSSAGLVTVLTTALLSHYSLEFDINSPSTLNIIHNLAQVAHCQAQGKVGSGFDVAAATFGSIVYRRFDPKLINDLHPLNEIGLKEYHQQIRKLVDDIDWDIKNNKVALPSRIRLIMGDIKGGSNTPKLVSKVLRWRKTDPESSKIYSELNNSNLKLINSLSDIKEISSETIDFITKHNSSEILASNDPNLTSFKSIISAISIIRSNFREITKRSGADIEPSQQTVLLDECLKINGVLTGVVPGAGGYDAICLLVSEDAIENLYKSSKANSAFKNVSWLNLSEEAEGVRAEDLENYIQLL